MINPIDPVTQPRLESLVTDALSGEQRRQTEYSGTVWFGGRPEITAMGIVTRGGGARIESPFFLPDSLPYVGSRAGEAIVTCTVALQSQTEGAQVLDYRAALAPDPRGGDVAWLQLQVSAYGRVPLAISYRIVVRVPPEAIVPNQG